MSAVTVPSIYDVLCLCIGPDNTLRPVHEHMNACLRDHILQIAQPNGAGYLRWGVEATQKFGAVQFRLPIAEAGFLVEEITSVSCRALLQPSNPNQLVFKNQADVVDPVGALLSGKNLGDMWLEELLLGPKRPVEAPQLLQELDQDPTWQALQESFNYAIGLHFTRAEDGFKIEKHVKQLVHDTLRAWILNAWVERDDVVNMRSGIVRLLGKCIVFGSRPAKPADWVVLFA